MECKREERLNEMYAWLKWREKRVKTCKGSTSYVRYVLCEKQD